MITNYYLQGAHSRVGKTNKQARMERDLVPSWSTLNF